MVALPEVGEVRPTIIRIEVDLPAPFGPRKPVTRPARATKVTSSTAVLLPYFLVRLSIEIMASSFGGGGLGSAENQGEGERDDDEALGAVHRDADPGAAVAA